MWHRPVVHKTALRDYINAGIYVPLCKTTAKLLDMDSCRRRQSMSWEDVTCKKCREMYYKGRS